MKSFGSNWMGSSASDKYFETTKKGEIGELRKELNHNKEDKKKEAVKKVIAFMTVGKDVSPLFTDVVNCMQTDNLELKKLVYLYLMNYAKTHPEKAILAVNTFNTDATKDPNPLIRALAIRTMGCIRIDKITEYLCEPLRKCLTDSDPYVLKTAAVCVAKLYDINPTLVEEQDFLDSLRNLLSDSNPMVVANAVAALTEIDEASSSPVFKITANNRNKLLAALEECTEWGQVYILNSLSRYTPKNARHAQTIVDRVSPRLQHANSAVVLAAVKVLMRYVECMDSQDAVDATVRKIGPPLVTLLSKEPEIQYVALRNINVILQKRPDVLKHEMKVFFCKYNDPIYVKMEKLEIIIMLVTERNVDQVLLELKEYATDVDVEFVRKAVRAIGRCAIKLEKASEKCIHVLLELIKTKINYVVQEAVIVIKDIFRKYPDRYESIISILCANLESLDEPEAKASMIWIIGEYADRIDNADELLDSFLEGFKDENPEVQLQLLTAIVKLFLKRPSNTQAMVQDVLNLATQESENPDLRDRGFIYWRLLSTDPDAAKRVVLGDKPLISDISERIEPNLLDDLIENIATLASVYHKPPETFVPRMKGMERKPKTKASKSSTKKATEKVKQVESDSGVGDLLGGLTLNEGGGSTAQMNQQPIGPPLLNVVDATAGKGLQISASFRRRGKQMFLDLQFTNHSQSPFTGFQIQFNKNTFQLIPLKGLDLSTVMPGQTVDTHLPVDVTGQPSPSAPTNIVQMAIKTNVDVLYFNVPIALHALFVPEGKLSREDYQAKWKSFQDERFKDLPISQKNSSANGCTDTLQPNNIFFVASRKENGQDILYFSAKTSLGDLFLFELTLPGGGGTAMDLLGFGGGGGNNNCKLCTKTDKMNFTPFAEMSLQYLLSLEK